MAQLAMGRQPIPNEEVSRVVQIELDLRSKSQGAQPGRTTLDTATEADIASHLLPAYCDVIERYKTVIL